MYGMAEENDRDFTQKNIQQLPNQSRLSYIRENQQFKKTLNQFAKVFENLCKGGPLFRRTRLVALLLNFIYFL